MQFSIIIPVYKVEDYIEKCLLSCLRQDFPPEQYEIIVVDDESPDDSINVAHSVVERFPHHYVKYISRKNGGLSAARNTGFTQAKGKYVWFVDSDDYISENALKDLSSIIEKYHPDVISFNHFTVFPDKTKRSSFPEEICNKVISGIEYLDKERFLSACDRIYKHSFLIENCLVFHEGILWEDSEFNIRAFGVTNNMYCINAPFYYYVRRPGSITTECNLKRSIDSRFKIITSVCKWFEGRNLNDEQIKVINTHIANAVVSCSASIYELPKDKRKSYRAELKNSIQSVEKNVYNTKSLLLNVVIRGIRYWGRFVEPLLNKRLQMAIRHSEY